MESLQLTSELFVTTRPILKSLLGPYTRRGSTSQDVSCIFMQGLPGAIQRTKMLLSCGRGLAYIEYFPSQPDTCTTQSPM